MTRLTDSKQCVTRKEGTGSACALRTISWGFADSPRLQFAQIKTSGQSRKCLTSLSLSNVRFMHTNFAIAEIPAFVVSYY